jgi:hypothetical protein
VPDKIDTGFLVVDQNNFADMDAMIKMMPGKIHNS